MDSAAAESPAPTSAGQGEEAHDTLHRRLEALRQRGAHRFAAVRFHFMEQLARRAAVHGGTTRRLLETRLSQLLEAYEADAAGHGEACEAPGSPASRGPLAELLDEIGRASPMPAPVSAHAQSPAHAHQHAPAQAMHPGASAGAPAAAAGELKALQYFRSTWEGLLIQQRLNDSLAKAPKNAGPLNSPHLVYRALSLMHETSPEYLNRFVSYVDTLVWLDQATGGGLAAQAARSAAAPEGDRKVPRRGR